MTRRERLISSMKVWAGAVTMIAKAVAQVVVNVHKFNVALRELDKALRKRPK